MSQTENKAWNEQENKGIPFPSPAESGTDPAITNPPSDEIYTGQDYRSVSTKEAEKKDSIGKDISILVMITLVSGLLLGIAYGITKDPIAKAQEDARVAAQRMVMRSAKSFETKYSSSQDEGEAIPAAIPQALEDAGIAATKVTRIDTAYDENHSPAGYVFTVVDPDGYGGDVELMCGIVADGDGSMTIEGISFLSLSETAGMGMRAKDEAFMNQFSDRKLEEGEQIVYVKDGAAQPYEIDAISGCTITTSAVTDDVNAALIAAGQITRSGQAQPQTESSTEQAMQEESE